MSREPTAPLAQFKKIQDDRHIQNQTRLNALENSVSYISGQLKIILAVLLVNGGLDLYRVTSGK